METTYKARFATQGNVATRAEKLQVLIPEQGRALSSGNGTFTLWGPPVRLLLGHSGQLITRRGVAGREPGLHMPDPTSCHSVTPCPWKIPPVCGGGG